MHCIAHVVVGARVQWCARDDVRKRTTGHCSSGLGSYPEDTKGILPQRSRRQIPDLRSPEPSESEEAEVMEDDLEPVPESVDPIP